MPDNANPYPPPSVRLTNPVLRVNNIRELFTEVRGLLDNVVYYWNQILFRDDELKPQIASAWEDVKSQALNVAAEEFSSANSNDLKNAGLAEGSAQLGLKLKILNDLWDRFKQVGGVRSLTNLLDYLSVLFDSLSKVFPQLEACKEFVDALKWLTSRGENAPASATV